MAKLSLFNLGLRSFLLSFLQKIEFFFSFLFLKFMAFQFAWETTGEMNENLILTEAYFLTKFQGKFWNFTQSELHRTQFNPLL